MARVEKRKPNRVFLPNKDIGGSLYGRTVRHWRGRKYVVWVPWTIEVLQDICAYHSIDLEEELARVLTEEIERESENQCPSPEETMEMMYKALQEMSDDEYLDVARRARELVGDIKFE